MSFSDASTTGGATSLVNADTHRFITYDERKPDPNGVPEGAATVRVID